MDRKSGKKIVRFAVLWLACAVPVTLVGELLVKSEIHNREQQMEEIIIIHPELKQEMMQNFKFYQRQVLEDFFLLWVFVLVLLGVSVVAFYFIWQWQQRKDEKRIYDGLEAICTQLEQFRRGNFDMTSYFFMEDGDDWETQQESAGITGSNLSVKIRSGSGSKLPAEAKNKSENDYIEDEQWGRIRELLQELAHYFSDMKDRLAEEENSTKALITDISHQLKTPLASLRMSHELAEAENLTECERREFLEKEAQEIEKLEVLLDELVDLSRLENHMIQVKTEYSGIKQTIIEAVNQVFMKAHTKNVEIQVKLEEDVVVRHDRKWTVEALANVMDNAVKYSEPQTCIEIRVSCLPRNLLIEIEDEGIGIPEEDLHRIFKRFYRGKLASEYARAGAGVGLYLTRNILEQQGGSIVAKRKMEQGTIFKITLPLA